jgi:glutathione S-transferase
MTGRSMSELVLYDFGNSVCCQKVRITLIEKGLTWQARRVDLFKTEQYNPDYLKLNPKGVVPPWCMTARRSSSRR